jgi:hypothetical protein
MIPEDGDRHGPSITLPIADGREVVYRMKARSRWHDERAAPPVSRRVFAAAHVVSRSSAARASSQSAIDWDATMAFRHHLWNLGLGVAEAMDTAQRGAGLDWPAAKELVRRTGQHARDRGAEFVCGATTDSISGKSRPTVVEIANAYVEQANWAIACGATPVIMASPHMAAVATSPLEYANVYSNVLRRLDGPAILHWLGSMFDPSLTGYWGTTDLDDAQRFVVELIADNSEHITGIKLSLLSEEAEVRLRRALPEGVRMFTGDDFNYVPLIEGDGINHSDALLGVFDSLAAPARAALTRLDEGDVTGYRAILEPTVPMARHMFAAPTSAYKTGVVFIAWLNGHQEHFRMLNGAENARSLGHLVTLFRLADEAGALADPDLAVERMRRFLAATGVPT